MPVLVALAPRALLQGHVERAAHDGVERRLRVCVADTHHGNDERAHEGHDDGDEPSPEPSEHLNPAFSPHERSDYSITSRR